MSPAEIEAELQGRARDETVVWPEHHATWDTWMAMANQWRVVERMSGPRFLGLNFPSIPEALEMVEVPAAERAAVRRNLRYMEELAVPILNGVRAI